jgi:hypothetical protein
MEVTDYIDLLKYSDFTKDEYKKIINFCNLKIFYSQTNKLKLFVTNEIKNSKYNYLDHFEKTDFLNFIKRIVFINNNFVFDNNIVYKTILFEYQRCKYKLFKKINQNKEITFYFIETKNSFEENVNNFIKELHFLFCCNLLVNFFKDLLELF